MRVQEPEDARDDTLFHFLEKLRILVCHFLVGSASSGHHGCIYRERGCRPTFWVYHLQSPDTVQQESDGLLCDCGKKWYSFRLQ